jgi:isopenicillin N synthase-like dioxygenase
LARAFALLPEATRAKYEDAASFYQFGWSLGKEKLQGGRPDYSKGSYYANPLHDVVTDDPAVVAAFPAFCSPNVWPAEADVPGFEEAFKALGRLIVAAGVLVARRCDAYVQERCPTFAAGTLASVVEQSRCCKARLLHYYATSETAPAPAPTVADAAGGGDDNNDDDVAFSSWCGWHNDHGLLTGLTSALLLDERTGEPPASGPDAVDPRAGLYTRTRRGELVQVAIPADCVAFQIGETAQVLSGGLLQATPHAVRASAVPGVSRDTFAVFMEPEWDYTLQSPPGVDPQSAQTANAAASLPKSVPPLGTRWTGSTMTFGAFTQATLEAYH